MIGSFWYLTTALVALALVAVFRNNKAVVAIGGLVVAGVVLFLQGKKAARRELELERAKATARNIEERLRVNEDVSNDPDLLDRARRSGVVRRP